MEILKPLHEITAADPRHGKRHETLVDPSDAYRPPTLADLHGEMAKLELPKTVPETLRSAFAVARTAWVYGWYYWPIHTVAAGEALRCVEMALRVRCMTEGVLDEPGAPNQNRVTLSWLVEKALDNGWIQDAGFRNFHRIQADSAGGGRPGAVSEGTDDAAAALDPAQYSRHVLKSLRLSRNLRFHPGQHSHGMPENERQKLELAHEIIVQLFPGAGE